MSPTVVNPVALARIRKAGGEPLLDKLLEYFLASAPTRYRQLVTAMDRDDWKEVEFHAHALKSSSGNVGAETLRGILNEIECAAEARQPEVVHGAQGALQIHFEEFMQALQSLKKAA